MSAETKSLPAVIALQKFFADTIKDTWPENDVAKSIEASIKSIENVFSVHYDHFDLEDSATVEWLQKMVADYVSGSKTKISDYYLGLISCYLLKITVPEMDSNSEKVLLWASTDTKTINVLFDAFENSTNKATISSNILYHYFNQYDTISSPVLERIKNSCASNDLYFDREKVKKHFSRCESYAEQLQRLEIPTIYQNTKYFNTMYFDWIITSSILTDANVLKNIFKTKQSSVLSQDQWKVVIAKAVCDIYYSKLDEESKSALIVKYLLPFIGKNSPNNPAYWQVEAIIGDKFAMYLKKAPKIFSQFYTSDFITIFFDALIDSGQGDTSRASFWKGYKNKIKELHFGLNSQHIQIIKRYIFNNRDKETQDTYLRILDEYKIVIQSNAVACSAVIILVFDDIIVTDFSTTGYVTFYKNNEQNRKYLLGKTLVTSDKDLKDIDDFYSFKKIKHSDNWRYHVAIRLGLSHGISI